MSWRKIPVRSDIFAYSMRVELDQKIFILSFRYNARMDKWVMDIYDDQGNTLMHGIVLYTNFPLAYGIVSDDLPQGEFVCVHITGDDIDAGRDNFGTDVKLLYKEAV